VAEPHHLQPAAPMEAGVPPPGIDHWSLTSLQPRLVKTGPLCKPLPCGRRGFALGDYKWEL